MKKLSRKCFLTKGKKTGLKFYPGLALIRLQTTGSRTGEELEDGKLFGAFDKN